MNIAEVGRMSELVLDLEFIENLKANLVQTLQRLGVQPTGEMIAAIEALDPEDIDRLRAAWLSQPLEPFCG